MGEMGWGITKKQKQRLIKMRQREQYLWRCLSPKTWLQVADRHMRAADVLYEIAYAAHERYYARNLASLREVQTEPVKSRTLEGQELTDEYDKEMLREYLLLAGYALECVFKGYLLCSRPQLVARKKPQQGEQLDDLVLGHDLCELATECGFSLADEERPILGLISRYLIWGKYASPKKLEDMPSLMDPDTWRKKSLMMINACHNRKEQRIVKTVYYRLIELLKVLPEPN